MNLRTKFALSMCLLGVLCLILPGALWADNTAITLVSYTNFTNGAWMLGFEFAPNIDIHVTTLGSYFPGGATDQHGVSIWNTAGNLLATATVTGTGVEGFDFTAIAPLGLTASTDYVIGATTLADNYADGNPPVWITDPNITYITHRETPTTGITPTFLTGGAAFPNDFGANFQYQVPEPSILILLGMSCLSMPGLLRKWRI